jgi:hypothetical protein
MIPLLPFIAGLAVGAVATSALRNERTKNALNETGTRLRKAASAAESKVREATKSGLAMLHRSSEPAEVTPAAESVPEKKPSRKSAATRTTAKPAVSKTADKPVTKRVSKKPAKPKTEEEPAT